MSFPQLKIPVILQIMAEVNIPLTELELTEPQRCKERIRDVFVQLVSVREGSTMCVVKNNLSCAYMIYMRHMLSLSLDNVFVLATTALVILNLIASLFFFLSRSLIPSSP